MSPTTQSSRQIWPMPGLHGKAARRLLEKTGNDLKNQDEGQPPSLNEGVINLTPENFK